MRSTWFRGAVGLALIAGICWSLLTLIDAIRLGKGHGPVFVAALVLIGLVTIGLGRLLLHVYRWPGKP